LGWVVPRKRRQRGGESQLAVGQRQPICAPDSDPGSSIRREEEGQSLPISVPQVPSSPALQRGHLGHRPPTGPPGLEDPPRSRPLYRTRPGNKSSGEETPRSENGAGSP